jgi:hypothetical protein
MSSPSPWVPSSPMFTPMNAGECELSNLRTIGWLFCSSERSNLSGSLYFQHSIHGESSSIRRTQRISWHFLGEPANLDCLAVFYSLAHVLKATYHGIWCSSARSRHAAKPPSYPCRASSRFKEAPTGWIQQTTLTVTNLRAAHALENAHI